MEAKAIILFSCLLTFLLLGCSQAQNEFLPGPIEDIVQNNTNQIEERLAQGENILKEKCEANAGQEWRTTFSRIQEARTELETCIRNYINMTELQREMEAKRKEGKLDEVFKKYCLSKNTIQVCLKTFTDTLKPCLKEEEKKNLNVVHNITNQLADFICYKEGDRIALFIAEKGPECMQNHTEEIQACVQNHTDAGYTKIDPKNITVTDLTQISFVFNDQACKQMDAVKDCVVNKLKNCDEPTPSNIAEALFKFVRKATPCSAPAQAQHSTKSGAASCTSVALAGIFTSLAAIALM